MVYSEDYKNYQLNRSPLRKFLRRFLLRKIIKYVKGPTIDFGCGIGELLQILPDGSAGLDINPYAVDHCKSIGLESLTYDPEEDKYHFLMFEKGQFSNFVMSHVLEHFENPSEIFKQILKSCNRLEINNVVLIVPGIKGFNFDPTHKTFVDKKYMINNDLVEFSGYKLSKTFYHPMPIRFFQKIYTYNSLYCIYTATI